jgi:hypothetical protein
MLSADLCNQQQHDAAWRLFRQAAARKLSLPLPVYHKLLRQAGQVSSRGSLAAWQQFSGKQFYSTFSDD